MPVQDLTPQLRTRLSQVERVVGWFVIIATILLLAGFSYYIYRRAEDKGWFLTKLRFHTFVASATGLKVGDPVILMGFPCGEVTKITAMPPFSTYGNVYVEFIVRDPYYGYIWTDSYVKLVSAGFLGSRSLEVVPGGTSGSTNLHESYRMEKGTGKVLGVWDAHASNWVAYTPNSKGYSFTNAQEAPVITDRLEELAKQAEKALPGIFDLTNQVNRVLTNAAEVAAHADSVILQAQPLLTNLASLSAMLTNGPGALGDWLIPTNINVELERTLTAAHSTLDTANGTLNSANTNVTKVALNLDQSLVYLANITSNLNAQVQRNDQILSQLSAMITNADSFVQGLKHHWLLRSAFRKENASAPARSNETLPAPASRPPTTTPPKTGKRSSN
jgi:ABC-type transporter Mla subunit MlaD